MGMICEVAEIIHLQTKGETINSMVPIYIFCGIRKGHKIILTRN